MTESLTETVHPHLVSTDAAPTSGSVQNRPGAVLQRRALARFTTLFPEIGPWTEAALWHGVHPVPIPDAPLSDELNTICDQRLAPLMLGYLKKTGAECTDADRDVLQTSAYLWSSRTHQVLKSGQPLLDSLRRAGIQCVVSKGPGIAATYNSFQERPFSDIDILVARADFKAATIVAKSHGFTELRDSRQPWPYFDRWCREGVNMKTDDGASIDLHHHVPPWFWSRDFLTDDLVPRGWPRAIRGAEIPCLSNEDNLLLAALHVVSDRNHPGATLMVWRDVVQLSAACPSSIAGSQARAAGLACWLLAVLQALPEGLRPQPLIDDLLKYPSELKAPWRVAALLSDPAAKLGVKATQVLRLPLANGLAYAGGMLLPRKAFLVDEYPESRGGRYRRWWSRALS